MAAFSRGSASIARCWRTSPPATFIAPSIHTSGSSLFRSLVSIHHFSHSSTSRKAQKMHPKSAKLQIQQLKKQLEERKLAQKRADEIRAVRMAELQAMNEAEEELEYDGEGSGAEEAAGGQAEQNGQSPVTKHARSTTQAHSIHDTAYIHGLQRQSTSVPFEQEYKPKQLDKDTMHQLMGIMSKDAETVLYRAPKHRWRLGLASLLLLSCVGYYVGGIGYWIALTAEDASVWAQLLNMLFMSMGFGAFLLVYRRRSLYVRQITLVPTPVGSRRVMQLEVQGSSWVPFVIKTVKAPLWDMHTNRALAKSNEAAQDAAAIMNRRTPVSAYYNLFQVPVWCVRQVQGVYDEMRFVLLSMTGRYLTKLYTEEGNTSPLSSWNIDVRGTFWGKDPDAFDYLVQVDPDANKGNFITRG